MFTRFGKFEFLFFVSAMSVVILAVYFALDQIIAFDVRIANLFFAFRSFLGVRIFSLLTLLAEPIVGATVIILVGVALFLHRQWRTGLLGILGFFVAEGITVTLKLLLHRARPDILLRAISEDSYSLPSGHATIAVFVFGFVGYLMFQYFHKKTTRVLITCVVVLGVIAIDFSRLYLGVHYLSDVLAGNAVGFIVLFVTIWLDQRLSHFDSSRTPRSGNIN